MDPPLIWGEWMSDLNDIYTILRKYRDEVKTDPKFAWMNHEDFDELLRKIQDYVRVGSSLNVTGKLLFKGVEVRSCRWVPKDTILLTLLDLEDVMDILHITKANRQYALEAALRADLSVKRNTH